MISQGPFYGVMTAVVTPFLSDLSIDFKSFHKLLDEQKKAGIHGVVIAGTTGESPTLSDDEICGLISAALEHQSPSFRICIGTGGNDTSATISKTRFFSRYSSLSGRRADGVMVVTPYYNKPTQSHLVKHFTSVAQSVPDVPVCLYNVPSRTGVCLSSHSVELIARSNANVQALKEASGNLNLLTETRLALNDAGLSRVLILSGDDASFGPSLICGAQGVISVTSHMIPAVMLKIWNAFLSEDLTLMKDLFQQTYRFQSGVFSVPNPVGIKCLLAKQGHCLGFLRPPLYSADEQEQEFLEKIWNGIQPLLSKE